MMQIHSPPDSRLTFPLVADTATLVRKTSCLRQRAPYGLVVNFLVTSCTAAFMAGQSRSI
jgi:hypothetical protein